MKALPIHEGAFTVLSVFDCQPRDSERFAQDLAEFVESRTRFHPGFVSALVYLSEDARRVVKLFQWARVEDWEAYCSSDDGREAARWHTGRSPTMHYLELVRCVGVPPPGESGTYRVVAP